MKKQTILRKTVCLTSFWVLCAALTLFAAQRASADKEPKANAKPLLCVLQANPKVETVGKRGIRIDARSVLTNVARYQAHIAFVIRRDSTGACQVHNALAGTTRYTEPMTNAWNQWLAHAQTRIPNMRNKIFVKGVQYPERQGGCVMTTEVYQGRDPKEVARELAQAVQRCEIQRIDSLTEDNQHIINNLRADS